MASDQVRFREPDTSVLQYSEFLRDWFCPHGWGMLKGYGKFAAFFLERAR